jgi:hypothetical protein
MVEELVLKWEEMFLQLTVSEEGMGGVIYDDEDGNTYFYKKKLWIYFNRQAEEEAEDKRIIKPWVEL